ncbi:MAG: hypothetical protein Q9197_003457 [Variospora fuerteventurae]
MSTIDDIIGFLATFDNRLEVIENAMTVHHDHRATVQSILTGHGLSKIRLPIRDQPLPSLRYLGLNFDLAVVANTGAIPAAGPPGARPYHLTSTVVDVLFLSVQELAMRIDLLAGQVNGIVSRSDRLGWSLDRLAVQLDRLQATQDPGDDQTRVSRAKTVERTQFSGESLAALREKLRLEMQSMRAEQDGGPSQHDIHPPPRLTLQPADDIFPAPMPTSLPPEPSATAPEAAPPTRKAPTPPAATRSPTPSPPPRPDSPNLIFMSPPTPHPHPTTSIPPSKTIPAPSPSPHLNPLAPAFNPSSLVLPEPSFNPIPKAPITPPPPPPPPQPLIEEGKDLSPDIPIPRSQVAAALTNAFAIATRGMRFQTLAESRFAPKSTTSFSTSPKKNFARPASAFTKPTFASSIAPTITTTFAGNSSIPTSQDEEEAATTHAQIFKERFRGRGIAVGATTTDNGKGKGKGRETDEEQVVGRKRGGTAMPAAQAEHAGGVKKKKEKEEEEEEGGVYASLALFEDVVNNHNSGGGGGERYSAGRGGGGRTEERED